MIQLNNLRKELVEVSNDELQSVLGGADQSVGGVFGAPIGVPPTPASQAIPIGRTGVSIEVPTSGTFQPSDILAIPQFNLDIGKGTSLNATADGSFGVTQKTGPLEVTAGGNPRAGSTAIKANFGIRF